MKNKKSSSSSVLSLFLATVWLLIPAILILSLSGFKRSDVRRIWKSTLGFSPVWISLGLLVLWIILTVVGYKIVNAVDKHKEKSYRAKYITQHTVNDERFGSLTFDYDTKEQELDLQSCELPMFGKNIPNGFRLLGVTPDTVNTALAAGMEALRAAYDSQEAILASLADCVSKTYQAEGFQFTDDTPATAEQALDHIRVTGFDLMPGQQGCDVILIVNGEVETIFEDDLSENGLKIGLFHDVSTGQWVLAF